MSEKLTPLGLAVELGKEMRCLAQPLTVRGTLVRESGRNFLFNLLVYMYYNAGSDNRERLLVLNGRFQSLSTRISTRNGEDGKPFLNDLLVKNDRTFADLIQNWRPEWQMPHGSIFVEEWGVERRHVSRSNQSVFWPMCMIAESLQGFCLIESPHKVATAILRERLQQYLIASRKSLRDSVDFP